MRLAPAFSYTCLALSLAGVGGCERADLIGPIAEVSGIQAGKLTAAITTDGLSLSNQTERVVYLTAFESELATRIDWIPCTSGPSCKWLVQGERRTLAWSDIPGYTPEKTQFLVYWWNAEVSGDGQVRVTNMQTVTVPR